MIYLKLIQNLSQIDLYSRDNSLLQWSILNYILCTTWKVILDQNSFNKLWDLFWILEVACPTKRKSSKISTGSHARAKGYLYLSPSFWFLINIHWTMSNLYPTLFRQFSINATYHSSSKEQEAKEETKEETLENKKKTHPNS